MVSISFSGIGGEYFTAVPFKGNTSYVLQVQEFREFICEEKGWDLAVVD